MKEVIIPFNPAKSPEGSAARILAGIVAEDKKARHKIYRIWVYGEIECVFSTTSKELFLDFGRLGDSFYDNLAELLEEEFEKDRSITQLVLSFGEESEQERSKSIFVTRTVEGDWITFTFSFC
jgi:hypothetical protein